MGGKRGLSQIITTLILLVVSILLAAAVTYYGTNVTMVRTENEEIQFSKKHIWVNSTGAVAAFKLQNLGGKDVLLDKIKVRGVESSWSSVWYYRVPSNTIITGDLNVTSYDNLTGSPTISGESYTQATDDLPLRSGAELLVYIKGPDNIEMEDIGRSISMAIQTSSAQYMTEVNVESASTQ
jgi:hypothetical protein